MKRIFLAFVVIIIIFITIGVYKGACNDDPYAGEYVSSDNTIIKLYPNNKCTIIKTLDKESFNNAGKYTIENNNLNIKLENGGSNYYGIAALKGVVEGSRIKVYDSLENKYCIYFKN